MPLHPAVVLAPSLLLLAVAIAVPAASSAAAAPSGETLFRQRCVMCHAVEAGKQNPLGPNLHGVLGRKAGSAAFAYSPQLKQSGLTWTATELDRYLAAPTRAVPGTRMAMAVANPAERAALIGYLAGAR